MKAMMCEVNRKEDRMCGKQMERRQLSGKGHNAQPLRPAQWLCLKWPETPGLSGERGARSSSLPGATSAAGPVTGRLGGMVGFCSWLLRAGILRCSTSASFASFLVQDLSTTVRQGTAPRVGWVQSLDPLFLPGRLGRGMGHPASLPFGSTFPRLPFCFDKCCTSHFSLLILPAHQLLQ